MTTRRVRLHGQVGEALDTRYGADAEQHATELARHYVESAALNREHARAAARYSRLAAEQAVATLAYDEAAAQYERCLELVQAAPDRLGEDEAALWAELASCQIVVPGLRTAAWDSFDRGVSLRRERGEWHEFARALLRMFESILPVEIGPRRPLVDEALAALGGGPSLEVCRLLAVRSLFDMRTLGDADAERAAAMARALGLKGSDLPPGLRIRPPQALIARGQFAEAADYVDGLYAELGGDIPLPALLPGQLASALLGDLDRRATVMARIALLAREYGWRYMECTMAVGTAQLLQRRGDQAGAAALLTPWPNGRIYTSALTEAAWALEAGDLDGASQLLPPEDHAHLTSSVQRALGRALNCRILLALGRQADARAEFLAWTELYTLLRDEEEVSLLVALSFIDDALPALGDEPQLMEIAALLDGFPAMRGMLNGSSYDHFRGTVALRLDRVEDADRHFTTALEWSTRERCPIEAGRNHQGLAEVAERRGNHARHGGGYTNSSASGMAVMIARKTPNQRGCDETRRAVSSSSLEYGP